MHREFYVKLTEKLRKDERIISPIFTGLPPGGL